MPARGPDSAPLISVVGGESTGKSTLARALGRRLGAAVVAEELRLWVQQFGRVPDADEQWTVMRAQADAEAQALRSAGWGSDSGSPPQGDRCDVRCRWVISDSGPLMTAVYSQLYYDDDSLLPVALEHIRGTALVVVCGDEIAWVPDEGQRDGERMRRAGQELIVDAVHRFELPHEHVYGPVDQRVQQVCRRLAATPSGGL